MTATAVPDPAAVNAITESPVKLPSATYRLQMHGPITLPSSETARFDFRDAARIVPYLARLGISTLYLSPIWQATPGSSHGYDATDLGRVSDELGGEKGLQKLWQVAPATRAGHHRRLCAQPHGHRGRPQSVLGRRAAARQGQPLRAFF